jgi:hypothetical protein
MTFQNEGGDAFSEAMVWVCDLMDHRRLREAVGTMASPCMHACLRPSA